MFWAYLAGIGTVLVLQTIGVVLLLYQAGKAAPLTREQVEALRAKAYGTLHILKPSDDLPSRLESRN